MTKTRTARKLTAGIITIIVLSICLCITTFALIYASVTVENNLFETGTIKINLNDGKPVITEDEFIFEPGMTVERPFFIENKGTWAVYYKIYFDKVEGGLKDVLEITIKDGETVLWEGTAGQLTKDKVKVAESELAAGQKKELKMYFYFPPEKGNEAQNLDLAFELRADATQTKNNPDKAFD